MSGDISRASRPKACVFFFDGTARFVPNNIGSEPAEASNRLGVFIDSIGEPLVL